MMVRGETLNTHVKFVVELKLQQNTGKTMDSDNQ